MGIRVGNAKSSKMSRANPALGAEEMKEFSGFSSQREPIIENLRVLQPNCQPLVDLGGESPVLPGGALAGLNEFELALQVQNGLAYLFAIGPAAQVFHPRRGGRGSLKVEFFRRKQTCRAPANVAIENVRVDELGAVIGLASCYCSRTLEGFICH